VRRFHEAAKAAFAEVESKQMRSASDNNGSPRSFEARERQQQTAYFETGFSGHIGYLGRAFCLHPDQKSLNLAPAIRDCADRYFRAKKISWHTHSNHALSSQVCCLNFLMPLAEKPNMLSRLVGHALDILPPTMLEVEKGPDGRPWFIGFEWNGQTDYLHEGDRQGSRTRGANSTSADAVVRFQHNGRNETLLIEWKYTESYGQPIPPKGNPTRINRYQSLAFAPDGPIRNDLGLSLEDFFYEPFYQLLRQQMLAFQMEKAREAGTDRVHVLHISPLANIALTRVTSPTLRRFGIRGAFDVFRSLLVRPDDFSSRSTESVFGRFLLDPEAQVDWRAYLTSRYLFCAGDTQPKSAVTSI
jgi:hypothetical protein